MKLPAAIGLLAACVVSLALPDQVQAGFGRRGSSHSASHSSSSSSSRGSSSSQSSFSSGGFGRSSSSSRDTSLSRGRRDQDRDRRGRDHRDGWGSGPRYRSYGSYPRSWGYPVWGYGFGYVPSYPVVTTPVIVDGQPAPLPAYSDEPVVVAALAGDLTFGSPGPLLGLQLSLEGERLGFLFGYTAAFAPIADTPEFDTLHLLLGHLTYAFIASERVRVRAELGVHVAAAPLVTFAAPGAGLSAVFGLFGPLGLETRVFGNIWPYTQLDARAGLTLSLGGFGFGAGVRTLYLNDNGVLGSTNAGDTSDTFWGPYATVAVAL